MTVWYTYIGKVNFFYAEFFEQIIFTRNYFEIIVYRVISYRTSPMYVYV